MVRIEDGNSITGTDPMGNEITYSNGGPLPGVTVLPPAGATYMGKEWAQLKVRPAPTKENPNPQPLPEGTIILNGRSQSKIENGVVVPVPWKDEPNS